MRRSIFAFACCFISPLIVLFWVAEEACAANKTSSGEHPVRIYDGGWPAVHADSLNSDYSPIKGPRNITLAWHRKLPGTVNLGPTNDVNGRIFITSSGKGCHLHAMDQKTGEILWCSEEVNRFAVASSALLDADGKVFVGDNEAMHAFDKYGKLIWETPIEGFPFSAQFTHTGHLIFLTCVGRIYVLDRSTGKHILSPIELSPGLKYKPEMDARACMRGTQDCPYANTLAFDPGTGRFYFTYWNPGDKQASLIAMQYAEHPAPSIVQLWQNKELPGGSATSPDISFDGAKVYVNDNEGQLHALDSKTGLSFWKFKIGYDPGGSQSTSPEGIIMPAGGGDARLMCLVDRGDRAEILWQKDELFNRGVATQSAGNLAYVTVKTGRLKYDLVVVDVRSGLEIDREHLPGTTAFSVGTTIGPEGFIFVPTFNGHLFAFRPEQVSDAIPPNK